MTSHNPNLKQEEDAQVGIGTMIVFIATVLVAAVAAGVLINVSGDLQSQATSTGTQATQNVATSMVIDTVIGTVGTTNIETADIYVRLGAGSDSVPLDELIIHRSNGGNFATSGYITGDDPTATPGSFVTIVANENVNAVDPDNDDLLQNGDYIILRVDLTANTPAEEWAAGNQISLQLVPSVGSAVNLDFTIPKSITTGSAVTLY